MDIIVPILAALVALVVGGAAGYVFASKAGGTKLAEYEAEREKWRQAAESKSREAEDKIRDATARAQAAEKEFDLKVRDTRLKIKEELDQENDAVRARLKNQENRIRQKSDAIDKKGELLDKREVEVTGREKHLIVREKALVQEEKKYHALVDDWYAKVERAAGMTAQDAKKQLVDSMINEAKHDAASEVRRIEDEAREEAEKKAQKIIAIATQRVSTDYVNENSVSVVHLPNEDMKGRIIGREGRNIRALEAATGVDFIVDDTPEAVIISAHNPIRRAVARRTLEHLIEDGRIHPARIEEIVEKFTQEIERDIVQAGEQATLDAGVHGLHPELMKLLGRLKYRTSYSQNQLGHAVEVAYICSIMAAELGISEKLARRSGLLHDIGKAVDHETEGPHALIGMELCKKYNEPEPVWHAVGAHHEDIKMETPLDIITQVADALSGARPGARREMYQSYVKRLQDLEEIANAFNGVEKTYAIQAGRELRVIVGADKVSDDDSLILSRDIAHKIEEQMTYPGQIRVVVIREHRAVGYAR